MDITDIMTGVGILKRLFARQPSDSAISEPRPAPRGDSPRPPLDVVLYGGSHDLEVVGESHYQDALWWIVGARTTNRVRVEVRAVLVAEDDNVHDRNAISIWIDGMKVGYLSREDAEVYRPGLLALQTREGKSIGPRADFVVVCRPRIPTQERRDTRVRTENENLRGDRRIPLKSYVQLLIAT